MYRRIHNSIKNIGFNSLIKDIFYKCFNDILVFKIKFVS